MAGVYKSMGKATPELAHTWLTEIEKYGPQTCRIFAQKIRK